MISDLPLSERLSLKGKLFELQKKLQIIDLEQQLDEQCTYKPNITTYSLPNREDEFLDNIHKAEIIRKQRKELLARSAAQQNEETCTFSPTIFTKGRQVQSSTIDDKPVFTRLYEKGKEYKEQHQRRLEFYQTVDINDGSKLFAPRIPAHSSTKNSAVSAGAGPLAASADEFLYQDAKDRELRLQQMTHDYDQELSSSANASKMNPASHALLQQRAEKQARRLFLAIDVDGDGTVSYDDVAQYLQQSRYLETVSNERRARSLQVFWLVVNHYHQQTINLQDFVAVAKGFLLFRQVAQVHAYLVQRDNLSSGTEGRSSTLLATKKSDTDDFLRLLTELIREGESTKPSPGPSAQRVAPEEVPLFKPRIFPHSHKLAQRKEQKELQRLAVEELHTTTDGCDGSTVAASSVNTKRSAHDRLLVRAELTKREKDARADELRKQQLEECTFRPTLKAALRRSDTAKGHRKDVATTPERKSPADVDIPSEPDPAHLQNQEPVHERLYKSRKKPQGDGTGPPTYLQEMQACTFAPKIRPTPAYINAPAPAIAGFDQTVRRHREVLESKQKQQIEEENAFQASQISYVRSRELAKKGPEPFKLATEDRIQRQKEVSQQASVAANLIIDVKLGGAKNARIRVVEGDDPVELSQRFGKIYGLDSAAVRVLATVVRRSMVKGGLLGQHHHDSFYDGKPGTGFPTLGAEDDADEEYSSYTVTSESDSEGLGLSPDGGDDGPLDSSSVEDNGQRGSRPSKPKRGARGALRGSLLSQLL